MDKSRFEKLTAAEVRRMIATGAQEDLHLEFKTTASADFSDKNDRKNLAIALSGFANADGGIVIWGVDARRNAEGVDCAQGEKLVAKPALFLSRLSELSSDAVSPKADGIAHRVLQSRSGAFIASFVPASDGAPHMAKLGEDRYYKRNGARFVCLEHYDLEDMFGRRPHPKLKVLTRVVGGGGMQAGEEEAINGRLVISLENEGRGSARGPYLEVRAQLPYTVDYFGIDGNRNEGLARIPIAGDPTLVTYAGSLDVAIHPGVTLDVAAIPVSLNFLRGNARPVIDLHVSVAAACDGVPLSRQSLTVTGATIAKELTPPGWVPQWEVLRG
jgi:hypothetical protein